MNEINNIDDLLKVDESCAKESAVVFSQLGPNAMECANAGLQAFSAATAWVGEWEKNHSLNESFNNVADELGIPGQELYEIVRRPLDPAGEDLRNHTWSRCSGLITRMDP